MNAQEKKRLFDIARMKLKRASGFADAMDGASINMQVAGTLEQLTREANASVTDLLSVLSGNQPPRTGVNDPSSPTAGSGSGGAQPKETK